MRCFKICYKIDMYCLIHQFPDHPSLDPRSIAGPTTLLDEVDRSLPYLSLYLSSQVAQVSSKLVSRANNFQLRANSTLGFALSILRFSARVCCSVAPQLLHNFTTSRCVQRQGFHLSSSPRGLGRVLPLRLVSQISHFAKSPANQSCLSKAVAVVLAEAGTSNPFSADTVPTTCVCLCLCVCVYGATPP